MINLINELERRNICFRISYKNNAIILNDMYFKNCKGEYLVLKIKHKRPIWCNYYEIESFKYNLKKCELTIYFKDDLLKYMIERDR